MTRFISELYASRASYAALRLACVTGLLILVSGCTTIQSPNGSETTVHPDGSVVVHGAPHPEPSASSAGPARNPSDETRTHTLADTISQQEQAIKANAALLSEQTDKGRHLTTGVEALDARLQQGRAVSQKLGAENGEFQRLNSSMTSKIAELTATREHLTHDTESLQRACDAKRAEAAKLDTTVGALKRQAAELDPAIEARRKTLAVIGGQCDTKHAEATNLDATLSGMKRQAAELDVAVGKRRKANDELTEQNTALTATKADLERRVAALSAATSKPSPGQHEHDGRDATIEPRPDASSAAPPPVTLVSNGHSSHFLSKPWLAAGTAVMVLMAALLGGAYLMRKPRAFAFTLMDEATKSSSRMQLMPGDRVELGGTPPTKKSGTRNPASAYLTVDRRGRIALHTVGGWSATLNNRQISTADAPLVTAGNVIEVGGNGQSKRLLLGPITAVDQREKVSAKPMATSVRPV